MDCDVWFGLIYYSAFFGSEGHVALDRNPGPGYDTLLLRMIPGVLLSAFPHRQFHTLPGLLDSWAALPNSNPNACVPMQGGSLYRFYDGLRYDPAERRTHDLPCERRTRYRLSQPDTVDCDVTMTEQWVTMWCAFLYWTMNVQCKRVHHLDRDPDRDQDDFCSA